MRKEIKLKNQVSELDLMAQFIEETGEELELDMELLMNLNLVLEEMVSNIIFYAYGKSVKRFVVFKMIQNCLDLGRRCVL